MSLHDIVKRSIVLICFGMTFLHASQENVILKKWYMAQDDQDAIILKNIYQKHLFDQTESLSQSNKDLHIHSFEIQRQFELGISLDKEESSPQYRCEECCACCKRSCALIVVCCAMYHQQKIRNTISQVVQSQSMKRE